VAGDRLFLDTFYVQAILNPKDPHYDRALALLPEVKRAAEVVTTEAVLAEVGNALAGTSQLRKLAAAFIRRCYTEGNMTTVTVDHLLFIKALELYESRADKEWGLTDCISFVVMRDCGLMNAATGDRHFVQAGFRALMLPRES
jgi:predicted nucleic acid-binding protein